jgi:hypothetical protein
MRRGPTRTLSLETLALVEQLKRVRHRRTRSRHAPEQLALAFDEGTE